jgi:hypothetical protein
VRRHGGLHLLHWIARGGGGGGGERAEYIQGGEMCFLLSFP